MPNVAETGNQNPIIFTGPGTGECVPVNKRTAPFSYKIRVNVPGTFTYNDGCSPNITLGVLHVLPTCEYILQTLLISALSWLKSCHQMANLPEDCPTLFGVTRFKVRSRERVNSKGFPGL